MYDLLSAFFRILIPPRRYLVFNAKNRWGNTIIFALFSVFHMHEHINMCADTVSCTSVLAYMYIHVILCVFYAIILNAAASYM